MIIIFVLMVVTPAFAQEDKAIKSALGVFKSHVRLPPETEVKFSEKKEFSHTLRKCIHFKPGDQP